MPKILFLGQNPSNSAPHANLIGTRAGDTLLEWIKKAGVPQECCSFGNAYSKPTKENARPSIKLLDLNEILIKVNDFDAVVALGDFAQIAMVRLIDQYPNCKPRLVCVEHPSGLNRNLNEPVVVEEQISKIKAIYEKLNESKSNQTT